MRRRVASFCAALLFITCSVICGPAYASDIWTVDGNVDPWSDLEDLQGEADDFGSKVTSGEDEPAQQAETDDDEADSIFDGLDDTEFFGYTAVLDDGSIVEDGGIAGIDTQSVATGFTGRFLSDVGFAGAWYASGTSVVSWNVPTFSATPFSAFESNYPWSYQTASGQYLNNYSYWAVKSHSSQYQLFISFTDIADSRLDNLSLHGSITCYLIPYFASYDSSWSVKYYPNSAQLIAYYEGSDAPVILKSFSCSNGVVAFNNTTIDLDRSVREVGLRIILSDLPVATSGAHIGSKNGSQNVAANGWRLYLAKGSASVEYESTPNTSGTDMTETNGLLSGLIAWVKGIYESIVGLPELIGSIITGITELPGKLWTLISDGLQALFIPTEEQLQDISNKYDGLFEEKLGFVYQMFSFVVDTFGGFVETLSSGQAHEFVFPGIQFEMNGETFVLLPESPVSLDNALMDVLRPVLGTVVSMVCSLALVSVGFDMVVAVMSGASYIEFLSSKKEGVT